MQNYKSLLILLLLAAASGAAQAQQVLPPSVADLAVSFADSSCDATANCPYAFQDSPGLISVGLGSASVAASLIASADPTLSVSATIPDDSSAVGDASVYLGYYFEIVPNPSAGPPPSDPNLPPGIIPFNLSGYFAYERGFGLVPCFSTSCGAWGLNITYGNDIAGFSYSNGTSIPAECGAAGQPLCPIGFNTAASVNTPEAISLSAECEMYDGQSCTINLDPTITIGDNTNGVSLAPYYLVELSPDLTAVPLPPALPLLAVGFGALVFAQRRRRPALTI
jgi:hypothetical protein